MKKIDFTGIVKMILIALACALLMRAYAGMNGLIFHQYVRVFYDVLLFCGVLCLLYGIRGRIPDSKKGFRFLCSFLMVLWVLLTLFLLFLSQGERESVVIRDGKRMVKKESSFILFYEVSYHDDGNMLWYPAYPCVVENYDDGDSGQYIYSDYYDETGKIIRRVFADGQIEIYE